MEENGTKRFDDTNMPIKRTMKFGEVINKYPETVEILMENGIQCAGCGFAFWETIEQGISGHGKAVGLDLEDMLKKLNDAVLKNEQNKQ